MASAPKTTRLHDLAQTLYDRTLRAHLPRKLAVLNGVVVRRPRLLDDTDVSKTYEQALVASVRNHVQGEDTVVVVGGGFGVSTVAAARRASHVHTFEASEEHVQLVEEALKLNDVETPVNVHHEAVGPEVNVYGSSAPETRHPSELPKCDVLELDCEGAEGEILEQLEIRPRVLIVEVHPQFGVSEKSVRRQFNQLGYRVTDRAWEDRAEGVCILTAIREDR